MLRLFHSIILKSGLVMSISLLYCILINECKDLDDKTPLESSPVELRAVLINCELNDARDTPDNEATRFEREELFKHNTLRDCNKKLALTVKICSKPTSSGDEYVPVEHVLEGASRRRVRLLRPYVLRLRRDALLQAYRLRLVDTVRGILTTSKYLNNDEIEDLDTHLQKRVVGETRRESVPKWRPQESSAADAALDAETDTDAISGRKYKRTFKKIKREEHEQNVVIERESHVNMPQNENDNLYLKNEAQNRHESIFKRLGKTHDKSYETTERYQSLKDKHLHIFSSGKEKDANKENTRDSHLNVNDKLVHNRSTKHTLKGITKGNIIDGSERDFELYEIGSPDLWFKVHLQLFEKVSTEKGNTLWNDVTKGEFASVSSLRPQLSGRDVAVQYRAADAAARNEFALIDSGLTLLAPLQDHDETTSSDEFPPAKILHVFSIDNDLDYIVVPSEDVISVEHFDRGKHSLANVSEENTKGRRRVVVRVARALWDVMEDNINIATDGGEKYLTMVHRKPHCAQVDVEARADQNQLVRVGSSGRVAIVVVDSTRPDRSTITVQATNTGLAAARFRPQIGECESGLEELVKASRLGAPGEKAVLLPPRHSRNLRLELPVELPSLLQHCSVSLVNDDGESVAVRDVVLRRGDRCFCVWHCDCVCFDENPKLPCRDMSAARRAAAGLPARGERHARSAAYCDRPPLDAAVTTVGVIVLLLLLGLLKGVIGLLFPFVALWGLDLMLQTPRTLERYYERSLRDRCVKYDCLGWPVHPDTGERTVRVASRVMTLILNIIFFVVTPTLLLLGLLKMIVKGKQGEPTGSGKTARRSNAQDTQSRRSRLRRRRRSPRDWMTPHAEQLTTNLWQKDLELTSSQCKYARPLLTGERGLASDSEQDDTAFVLMHMRKSAESISKTQGNPDTPVISNPSAAIQ